MVRAAFQRAEHVTWKDIFEGFDEMYVITYSSGIDFVNRMLSSFEHAEIIFGCEGILNTDTAALISMQKNVVQEYCRRKSTKEIAEKLDNGSVRLYVSRVIRSHEKIYILKARDGRTRVVTGSANMSSSAFNGLQRENILCFDDAEAFRYYKDLFDQFREQCADSVSTAAIRATMADGTYMSDNIEEVPILKTIEKKKVVFLEESPETPEDVELVADIKDFANELKPMLPKEAKKTGKIMLSGDVSTALKRKYVEHKQVKEYKEKKLPKLHIDFEDGRMDFNGTEISLHPDRASVESDIRCLLNYFSGFSSFNGNTAQSQKDYYAFMNWFFVSPFLPYLRLVASKNNFDMTPFPVFGIIYGDSNGGKSTFARLLSKLMCGQKTPVNSSSDFTATVIEDMKRAREGLPIIIDDLAKSQFQSHNEKVIKDDDWGIPERFVNYPAVVITTNKLPSISSDISKRAVTCHIDAKINKEAGAKNSKKVNESMKAATTAFYGLYAGKMLEEIEKMADAMKTEEDYFPDIFQMSSDILCGIIEDITGQLPDYVQHLTYSDYFGDKAVSRNAMEKLIRAWETEKKQFLIDRKNNKLIYNAAENGRVYELRYIQDELPPSLESYVNQTNITMNLSEAEKLFGIRFRKGILGRG